VTDAIPTLTDTVEQCEPRNQFHAQLLEQVQGEAVETHYGERPTNELPEIKWWG